ncbi:MAG: cryptochrome/photolyase family protein [Elusimicrobia bacterium]|nr:cryptochrome/photolyase family protein [Elusimicrobiota bacterium]MBD3412432.1 cryptochrome/photolyase family protein [Elusimicrobiota bacterium]
MIRSAAIIFPHQLFKDNPVLAHDRRIFLVEHGRFFTDYNFHKHKLILHHATLQSYRQYLAKKNYDLVNVDLSDAPDIYFVFKSIKKNKLTQVHYVDTVDTDLENQIARAAKHNRLTVIKHETPMFLNTTADIDAYFSGIVHYAQTPFYIHQRKKFNILVDHDKPEGGQWSFDQANRKPLPKNLRIPEIHETPSNKFVYEAGTIIEKMFSANPGRSGGFMYPVSFEQAEAWLGDFLKNRFEYFGAYEDAISSDQHVLFHSVLSPLLNIGLLTPRYVVNAALTYARKHSVPLNSLEGFIRQIIGWREFIRGVYTRAGEEQRTTNYWKHNRPLSKKFYDGTTGIDPIDTAIHTLLNTGYVHHIERLMVLGNFMFLCEINPDDVYRWFMELCIDAYDWVMVPNVYGMSQYADGGLMTTKPYLSGSHYILTMSNYEKGHWCAIWDGLYWRFVKKHRDYFKHNPRIAPVISQLDRMDGERLQSHCMTAERFLASL